MLLPCGAILSLIKLCFHTFAVSPSYAVIAWAVLMRYRGSDLPCWADYLESPYIWIVRAPMIAAVFVSILYGWRIVMSLNGIKHKQKLRTHPV